MRRLVPAVVAAVLAVAPARAAPLTVSLTPGSAELGIRIYAMGIVPFDGIFRRFTGALTVDAADPSVCRVELSADVASLSLGDGDMQRDALSSDLLDAQTYPALSFRGACDTAGRIAGMLTLHGATRPITLTLERTGRGYVAEGSLQRADYGIVGRPITAGAAVRIRVTTELPQ